MIASWWIGYYIVTCIFSLSVLIVQVPFCCLVNTHDVSAVSNCYLKQDIQTKAQTLHNNTINWYTSHRLIKKTMFHCQSLILQRELHQNSGIFPLIHTNTYQHKFRPIHTNTNILPKPTNIHKHSGSPTFILNSHSTLH